MTNSETKPYFPAPFGRARSMCALVMALGIYSGSAVAQMTEPPDPQTCPKGLYYHARDDACVPVGATLREPPPLARPRHKNEKWSEKTAECILQHIDKAHVSAAVDPIIKACQSLDDQ